MQDIPLKALDAAENIRCDHIQIVRDSCDFFDCVQHCSARCRHATAAASGHDAAVWHLDRHDDNIDVFLIAVAFVLRIFARRNHDLTILLARADLFHQKLRTF